MSLATYEGALASILAECRPLPAVAARVDAELRGVLAAPVLAPIDLPSFDNSAVDGFAVQLPITGPLELVDEAPAGRDRNLKVDPGEAIRVFTGAPLPFGTQAVVMQEDVVVDDRKAVIHVDPKPGDHIRRRGEELRVGDDVLPAGHAITPPTLGVLATLGLTEVSIVRPPKVAIVSTGSELVPPGQPLEPGEVYASNGLALSAAARALGAEAGHQHVRDDLVELRQALAEAAETADVVVTAGGVSVGAFDQVRPAWRELGFEERFWRVAIKPGKPVLFGVAKSGALVFGLPGNPVSALVTFHLFVRPALRALRGLSPERPIKVRAGAALRAAPGRDEFVRVRLTEEVATPLERQGSHMASGLALADALVRVPAGAVVAEGDEVDAFVMAW